MGEEKTVVSLGMDSKGKLVRTYRKVKAEVPVGAESEEEGVDDDDGENTEAANASAATGGKGQGKFSTNPLLHSGGLIRPIWKPQHEQGNDGLDGSTSDSKGKTKSNEPLPSERRGEMWRRVQDDTEDNEQWILDGGLRGYGTETRIMEDGSQQECG